MSHDLPRFGNDETLKTKTMDILLVGIAGVNGILRVHVVPGEAPLLLSKECLKVLGCHIDLGRGHLFFETLGVRDVVKSEKSPYLFLPLTSFGPQGHRVPAEIQPRISSDECAVYRATCDSSRQEKTHSWKTASSDRRTPETDSTDTESQYGTDVQEQNPCDETPDYWDNMEGRWVRVHGIARRTLFDPMHDEQPFCQDLTARRRTTIQFFGQQSEMTIDDTWPQTGEMRSLWKGTTEFWTRDMPQDDTWTPNRHHSDILPLFRNHLTRNAVAMSPSPVDRVVQAEHERRDSHLHAVPRTEDAEKKGKSVGLKLPKLSNVYSTHHDDSSCTTVAQDTAVQ